MKQQEELTGVDLYIDKLEADRNMNVFLKYFRLPNLPIFLLLNMVVMSAAELLTHTYVPTVLAIYLMWECLVVYMEKRDIAEKCAVDEAVMRDQYAEMSEEMFPGEPVEGDNIVDRNFIMLGHVMNFKNMTFVEKIKKHGSGIFVLAAFYAIGYCTMWYLLLG